MDSVFNGVTVDLAVTNLTVPLPDIQKERTYTRAQKPLLLASEKPCNTLQTIGSSSLELSNLQLILTFITSSISLKFLSQASLISPQNSSSQPNFNLYASYN